MDFANFGLVRGSYICHQIIRSVNDNLKIWKAFRTSLLSILFVVPCVRREYTPVRMIWYLTCVKEESYLFEDLKPRQVLVLLYIGFIRDL